MRLLRCGSHSIYGTGSATFTFVVSVARSATDASYTSSTVLMKLLVSMLVLDLVQVGKLGKLLKPLMVLVLVYKLG